MRNEKVRPAGVGLPGRARATLRFPLSCAGHPQLLLSFFLFFCPDGLAPTLTSTPTRYMPR